MKTALKVNLIFLVIILLVTHCGSEKDPVSFNVEGDNWEVIANIGSGYIKLFFLDEKNGWAVGNNGQIKHTEDGGITWEAQNSGTESGLWSVLFVDDTTGFAAGKNKTLLRTYDGGSNWNPVTIESDATVFQSLHLVGGKNIWFISNSGELFRSSNLGQDWECLHDFNEMGYSYLYFYDNNVGYAMRFLGSEIKRTTDGGKTWLTIPLSFLRWSGDVFFLNDKYGWVSENWGPSSMIHETAAVYMTNNGGISWTQGGMIEGIMIQKIIFLNEWYGWIAANAVEVYYTTDRGKTLNLQYAVTDGGYAADMFLYTVTDGITCCWILSSEGEIIRNVVN